MYQMTKQNTKEVIRLSTAIIHSKNLLQTSVHYVSLFTYLLIPNAVVFELFLHAVLFD